MAIRIPLPVGTCRSNWSAEMRVAFLFSAAARAQRDRRLFRSLIESLRPLVDLEVFSGAAQAFDPSQFDIAVYQVGNNAHHDFVYETALRHPGVVVMHESNLHHLIADLTIRRGDWDAYVRECEYNGGAAARAFAERVRRARSGARLRRRRHDAAAARKRARRGGPQPVHAR